MAGARTGQESDRWGWNPLRDHVAKTTARPEFALIALICAGYEKTIQKDSWRSAGQVHNAYLTQLVTWGYTPPAESNRSSSTSTKPGPKKASNVERVPGGVSPNTPPGPLTR